VKQQDYLKIKMYKTTKLIIEAIGLIIGGIIGAGFLWLLFMMMWIIWGT
jgi:hypothetical protein